MMNVSAHLQSIEPDLPLVTTIDQPPWRDAFLAGLPYLWLAFSQSFSKLAEGSPSGLVSSSVANFATASFVILLGVSVLVTLYALLRRFPLWTASWYAYAAWTLVVLLGRWTASTGEDNWVLNNLLVLGAFGSILLGYLFIYRKSRLHALLVALFILPVASQIGLESIPAEWEAALALVFGVLAALVAAFILRRWEWQTGVVLAISANLLAGVLLIYISFTQTEITGFYGDTLGDALSAFALYVVVTLVLFLGPLLFWRLIDRLTLRRSAA